MADFRDRDRVIYDRAPPEMYPSRRRSNSPSPDRLARFDRRPRFPEDFTDDGRSDDFARNRDRYFHDEPSPRYVRREGRDLSPEYHSRRVLEREREARRFRSPSPTPLPRRPGVLRRQSSLDTFDRPRFYEREEYPPPARREDFRASYGAMPLTSRMETMRIDEGRRRYRDDELSDIRSTSGLAIGIGYPPAGAPAPERVREREVVKVRRRRSGSRDSLTTYSKRSSRTSTSSSSSSRSSSPSRVTSVRSDEYPKKGKTKIPSKLLSKRALIDLGYPFIDEGKTIVILKALNQDQIDQVLRVSDEYRKAELEISAARSSAGNIVEERREELRMATPVIAAPAPVIVNAAPLSTSPPAAVVIPQHEREVEVVKETVIRDMSPSRGSTYTTTTFPSTTTGTTFTGSTYTDSTITGPVVYDRRRRHSGPLVVRSKSRSRSRARKDIRAEIRALEAELHDRKHHRHKGELVGGDLVRVDRLGDGQVVMFEERVEKVEEGYRGPRIERDKKGRLSLSVPKRR